MNALYDQNCPWVAWSFIYCTISMLNFNAQEHFFTLSDFQTLREK